MVKRGNQEHPLRKNFVRWPRSLSADSRPPELAGWALAEHEDDAAEARALDSVIMALNGREIGSARPQVVCRFRLKACLRKQDPNSALPKPVTARVENFTTHQKHCVRALVNVLPSPTKRLRFNSSDNDDAQKPFPSERVLTEEERKTLHHKLLDMVHYSRLPDSFVGEPTSLALFEFLSPGISKYIPNRNDFDSQFSTRTPTALMNRTSVRFV
jgi:hypothetical protein